MGGHVCVGGGGLAYVLSVLRLVIPYGSYFSRELNFASESKKAFCGFKFRGMTDCSMLSLKEFKFH